MGLHQSILLSLSIISLIDNNFNLNSTIINKLASYARCIARQKHVTILRLLLLCALSPSKLPGWLRLQYTSTTIHIFRLSPKPALLASEAEPCRSPCNSPQGKIQRPHWPSDVRDGYSRTQSTQPNLLFERQHSLLKHTTVTNSTDASYHQSMLDAAHHYEEIKVVSTYQISVVKSQDLIEHTACDCIQILEQDTRGQLRHKGHLSSDSTLERSLIAGLLSFYSVSFSALNHAGHHLLTS